MMSLLLRMLEFLFLLIMNVLKLNIKVVDEINMWVRAVGIHLSLPSGNDLEGWGSMHPVLYHFTHLAPVLPFSSNRGSHPEKHSSPWLSPPQPLSHPVHVSSITTSTSLPSLPVHVSSILGTLIEILICA
ncbi:hypothetical protein L1987_34133 [Smallanthus sonchifolius]|uniref:Uncharacterized protein n=1 Tax=Smallanthus sonchifolius TaxID=185202 RepID=A0ACB9HSF3_9ASTR|nr:hypothetical protein L1987_34133 [Smallanthus sonchifolius]